MPRVEKTETFKKIEELAKKVPEPISWLLPDPNDPSSYMHPVAGLTRIGTALGVARALKKLGLSPSLIREEMPGVLKVIKAFRSDVLKPLKKIVPAETGFYRSSLDPAGPLIGIDPPLAVKPGSTPTFYTVQHELTHLYHEFMDPRTFRARWSSSGGHHFPFAPIVEGATDWASLQQLKRLKLESPWEYMLAHWKEPGWPDVEFKVRRELDQLVAPYEDPYAAMLRYTRKRRRELLLD